MTRRPTLTALAAFPTALATQNPDPGPGNYPIPPDPHVVTKVIHDGTPLWVFALVAAVTMSLAIAATLAWQTVRAHRAEQMKLDRIPTRLNETSSCRGG